MNKRFNKNLKTSFAKISEISVSLFNPNYALDFRHEGSIPNKIKYLAIEALRSFGVAMVNERNAAKRLILKGIEAVIGFLMYNPGLTARFARYSQGSQ